MTSMITPYDEIEPPNIDHIVTEDDEPVDNLFSEKQQRLLLRNAGDFSPLRFIASPEISPTVERSGFVDHRPRLRLFARSADAAAGRGGHSAWVFLPAGWPKALALGARPSRRANLSTPARDRS